MIVLDPQSISLSASHSTIKAGGSSMLTASGFSGTGSISYTKTSGDCTLSSGGLVSSASAGTCSFTATIAADLNYNTATSSTLNITVDAAPSEPTWDGTLFVTKGYSAREAACMVEGSSTHDDPSYTMQCSEAQYHDQIFPINSHPTTTAWNANAAVFYFKDTQCIRGGIFLSDLDRFVYGGTPPYSYSFAFSNPDYSFNFDGDDMKWNIIPGVSYNFDGNSTKKIIITDADGDTETVTFNYHCRDQNWYLNGSNTGVCEMDHWHGKTWHDTANPVVSGCN